MAIAATWVVNNTAITTTAAQLYTVPSTGYKRDLVVTAGTAAVYVGLSTDGTVATSAASFKVPGGGSIVLTQCQVPTGAVLSALTGSGTSTLSIGYGSLVSYT